MNKIIVSKHIGKIYILKLLLNFSLINTDVYISTIKFCIILLLLVLLINYSISFKCKCKKKKKCTNKFKNKNIFFVNIHIFNSKLVVYYYTFFNDNTYFP